MQFSPEWLANLFDEDNLHCSRGDYSRSLSDLIDMGHIKALEKYLLTDGQLGLQTKDFETIQRKYGKNVFQPLKLTSLFETLNQMMGDISLQFLLIAAVVAAILAMT